jgi:HlyD family secretion protein
VASIVQIGEQYLCWVKTAEGVNRRPIQLGDTNDEFTIVTAGLKEGDEVVLNPTAFVDDAQVVADQSTNNSAATTDS